MKKHCLRPWIERLKARQLLGGGLGDEKTALNDWNKEKNQAIQKKRAQQSFEDTLWKSTEGEPLETPNFFWFIITTTLVTYAILKEYINPMLPPKPSWKMAQKEAKRALMEV